MKEETRNTEVQINEEETGKLPEKEFRIMMVKIKKNKKKQPWKQMEKMQESINKYLKELKSKHTETNSTITKSKNTSEGINNRISEAEEWIRELEYKIVEITAEDSLRDLWDNIKCTNIWIIGVPDEKEKKKEYEKIFEEIMVEKFPNMEKEIVNQESHTG